MPRNPKVDAYIARAAEFAQPILAKIRALFHKGCPKVEETMKWGFPHFECQGILGSMAAFKNHVSIGFWKAALLKDPQGLLAGVGNTSMAALKAAARDDLPADRVLLSFIKQATKLNEDGVAVPRRRPTQRGDVVTPPDLQAELKKHPRARETFEAFSPSHQREYVEWITEAKQEATRARRLAAAIEMLNEGKSKNWKYTRR